MRQQSSFPAAVPGRSQPGLPKTGGTPVWCTVRATAPPGHPSPEGGDTCRGRETRPLVGESRKLQEVEEAADGPEAPVDDDLRPARSHHQVQLFILDGDGVAGGFL